MIFRYPETFVWMSGALALGTLLFWSRWKRRREIANLGNWTTIRRLIPVEALYRRRKKDWIAFAGFVILVFAAAGPQFGSRMTEVTFRGSDVFIAIDTSRSMLAEDVRPTRLDRAKRALHLLIQRVEGNRIGIIAFARFAVIQCPLTIDAQAARLFLDIVGTDTVPLQGTSIGDAIRLALKSFPEGDKTGRAIVLLTDGEDHRSDPVGAAKEAKEAGVVIYTVGIGSTKGEVIKKRDAAGKVTEFHKHEGEMVLSRLDDALLAKIASITGGEYFRASSTDREIDEIADRILGIEKQELTAKKHLRTKARYQWFAGLAFLLLLFEFLFAERPGQRRRLAAGIGKALRSAGRPAAALALLSLAAPAAADVETQVRRGAAYAKDGNMAAARKEFEAARIDAPEAAYLPYNIATAYYLEGDFDQARAHYEQALELADDGALKSKIAYNLGHVLFHLGEKEAAIERFKESARLDPSDTDAKYNIEYIRAGLKPTRPMPKKEPSDGKDDQEREPSGDEGGNDQNGDGDTGESTPRKGELSREDAERVLELIEEREEENIRRQPRRFPVPDDKKNETPIEDW